MRVLLVSLLVTSCKIDLDHGTVQQPSMCTMGQSTACMDAPNHQELSWLQSNIFNGQCTFQACHDGSSSTVQGKHPDLTDGHSYASLVGHAADIDNTRTLVVAGDPTKSYLLVMVGQVKPADAVPPTTLPKVGLMPQSSGGIPICCQKLDAIERWIMDGALNN